MSDTPPIPENQTATYKAAKLAVIILSTLIILALIALVVGFIFRLGGKSSSAPGTSAGRSSAAFQLPPGGEIVEMQTQPGRLILRVRSGAGEEIAIIDTQDGRLVSQIRARVDVPR